ncbi:MAG: hypothetical protein WAM14_01750 [Candidatus Nitrosopolaris sp.]
MNAADVFADLVYYCIEFALAMLVSLGSIHSISIHRNQDLSIPDVFVPTTNLLPIEESEKEDGSDTATEQWLKFMQCQEKMNVSSDYTGPSVINNVGAYKSGYIDVKRRGAKIRFVTEITKDNIAYCRVNENC